MRSMKGCRTVGRAFQIGIVRREEPCAAGLFVLAPIAAHKNLPARLTVQEFEHSSAAAVAPGARLGVQPSDRRSTGAVRRTSRSSRTTGIDADPESSRAVKEVRERGVVAAPPHRRLAVHGPRPVRG